MCIATAGLIASGVGTAVNAIGAIGAGSSAAAQSRYQAQVAANNAVIAQQNANYAIRAGEARATDQGIKGRGVVGATRAALAASGLDVNSGSATDVLAGTAQTQQLDTERVRQEAGLRAYGYRTQSSNFAAEAQLDRQAARNDESASFLKAGGTLLAGIGSVGGKWDSLKTSAAQADVMAQEGGAISGPYNPYYTTI